MPLAGKSTSSKDRLRPGVTQSHRGRVFRNTLIALSVLAFLFTVFSNMINPGEETLTAEEQQAIQYEKMAPKKEPAVEAAPANAFQLRRVAALPPSFDGSISHENLILTSKSVARQLSTYSSKQTPEEYVKGVGSIDDTLRGELLKSSESMWPEIVTANVSVKGEDSGIDPIIREYNEQSSLAKVETVIKQVTSRPNGTSTTQTRAYDLYLVGVEGQDGNMSWTVGGFHKQ